MHPILIACGSCQDALELTVVQQALGAAAIPFATAWCGSIAAATEACALGLESIALHQAVDDKLPPAARAAAAATFAAQLLASPWRAVLTIGHGTFPLALGSAALREGVPVVRLGAGVRTHAALDPHERHRRLADHAASICCVASDWQRHEMVREGTAPDAVHVIGSLLADALVPWPRDPATAGSIWLAIEHEETVADRGRCGEFLAELGTLDLPVLAATTVLGKVPLPADALPANLTLRPQAAAPEQLRAALGARVLLTDSVGYQQVAIAAGIPCVAFGSTGVLVEGAATGVVTAADSRAGSLRAAVERVIGRNVPRAPVAEQATAKLLAVLAPLGSNASAAKAPAPAPPTLPSDGDASGRTLGEDEVALAAAAIRRGTLNSTRGTFVARFEREFATWLGRKHAIACASGSAAMHAAIAALQLRPGDEVITTPITDMGALTPILYEGGVPVFADVDPFTLNVTASTIRARLSERTRGIVATHLFGLPCDLAAIRALATERGLPLIEDAAQAFGATWQGAKVGTRGAIAAFSLQQGKHITTGEGGLVATDDDALARRLFLFVNKAWGYGDAAPDHYFPALNYRLTELQGAVGLAQLPKLDLVVAARRAVAAGLCAQLGEVAGLRLPHDPPQGTHSYWKFAFQVDATRVRGGAVALGKRMQAAGIACVPRYIQKPAFECELFRDWRASPVTWLPLQHNPRRDRAQPLFRREDFPGAVLALDQVIVLPINERYTPAHVERVAAAIRDGIKALAHG